MSEKSMRERAHGQALLPQLALEGVARSGFHSWPQSRGPLPCRQEDDLTGNFVILLTETCVRFEAL